MRNKRANLIASLIVFGILGAGLGWIAYMPIRQERLNRALIVAIKHDRTRQALDLLAEGADANSRDEPLQYLSLWRLLVDELQGKQPADSMAPTALWLACYYGADDLIRKPAPDNWHIIEALLERGAQVNVTDKETGETPLLQAAILNKTKVCQLLVERGANVNVTDRNGGTPLLWAIGNKTLVRLLVNKGADVKAGINSKALMDEQFSHNDDPTITELLLSRGARVDAVDHSSGNYTALDVACVIGRIRSVRLLIQHGANVNLMTSDGETPLTLAKEWQHPTIVHILRKAGAKWHASSQ